MEVLLCKPGDPVHLIPEPKNPHDSHAIAVLSERGVQLGYLTAERAPWIGSMIRNGREIAAVFQVAVKNAAWIRVAFDGEVPVLPESRKGGAVAASPEAKPSVDDSGFYPDEAWPDE